MAGLKLDIGSSIERVEGYTSVDLYMPAEIRDDVTKLEQFTNESVEEVRVYHLLEHLKTDDVPIALGQIFRVLKPHGKIEIEVPDLVWLLEDFLNTPEMERWGWKLQTLFGMQNHEGEFHRTGFSGPRLRQLLIRAGFEDVVSVCKFNEKYNQGIIDAVGYKP